MRGATKRRADLRKQRQFQSTRPLRGATHPPRRRARRSRISIHAPLAGRDFSFLDGVPLPPAISIHAPLAGRDHTHTIERAGTWNISNHAPLAGRDHSHTIERAGTWNISIHAPLAGRDIPVLVCKILGCYFNPRAPCGARPLYRAQGANPDRFQSTRPLRGATCKFPPNSKKML